MKITTDFRQVERQRKLFFFTALVCLAVPGFASFKAVAIIVASLYTWISSRTFSTSIIWFVSVVLNIVFCSEIAVFYGVASADTANQLERLALFFMALALGASAARSNALDAKTTDHLITSVSVIACTLKIVILIAVLSGLFSLEAIQSSLGFETVTDDIGLGLQRLQFPSDVAFIFLLSCYSGGRKKIYDLIFLVSITIGVFLSFSRFLFVAYVVCLLIRYLRIRKLDVISVAAFSMGLLLAGIFSITLISRFSGEGSQASDSSRTEQIKYLTEVIIEHPLLGTGIGSSVNGYKRSETIPFSYEVQWYAMTMQLGMIGLLWFVVNLCIPLSLCFRREGRRCVFFGVFTLWILAGLTNPLLVSLGSAFGLGILMLVLTRESSGSPSITNHLIPYSTSDSPSILNCRQ